MVVGLAFNIQADSVFFLTAKAGSGRAGRKPVLEGSSTVTFPWLLSSRAARRMCWCLALSLPRCRTLRFPLLNFLGLLPWQGTALG